MQKIQAIPLYKHYVYERVLWVFRECILSTKSLTVRFTHDKKACKSAQYIAFSLHIHCIHEPETPSGNNEQYPFFPVNTGKNGISKQI